MKTYVRDLVKRFAAGRIKAVCLACRSLWFGAKVLLYSITMTNIDILT